MYILRTAFALGTILLFATLTRAATAPEQYFPARPDPFVGNYVGRWSAEEEIDPDIAAQVMALGNDRYRIRLVSKLDMRAPVLADIEAERKGDTVAFANDRYAGEIRDGRITGGRTSGSVTFSMQLTELQSGSLGMAPPENAVVLFDGTDLSAWADPSRWDVVDGGIMQVRPSAGDLKTARTFKDVYLHLEFRLPHMPAQRGQARGNSGVFFQENYEVQILDSFSLEGYYDECGAIYKVAGPMVNACRPPLQWQTYDITYRAPRFDAQGNVTEYPRMTVYHNGILIHNDQEMRWVTGWKEEDRKMPHPTEAGPIRLQDHGNYIQFRNIWAVDLSNE
jgi:hypothetical protein